MSDAATTTHRQHVLAAARGAVLEVGCGTGLNFAHYPPAAARLVAIDPNPGMLAKAGDRAAALDLDITLAAADACQLPYPDASFDTVVSTWTPCSIPDVAQSIREIRRALKPDGQFLFVEHGASPEPSVRAWQNRLNPLQKRLADGCHLNRQIAELIGAQFAVATLDNLYLDDVPKFLGYLYRGIAVPV